MLNSFSEKHKISCPYCSYVNDDSQEDSEIECHNENCKKHFLFISCPFCNHDIYYQGNSDINNNIESAKPFSLFNNNNIKCPYFGCKQNFFLTQCPKCNTKRKVEHCVTEMTPIVCYKCNLNYVVLKCPFKDCKENSAFLKPETSNNYPDGFIFSHHGDKNKKILYQKLNCVFCNRPIVFHADNKYIEGQTIECPYKDCGKKFNRLICPLCYYENIFNGFYAMGSEIICQNPKCNNKFYKIACYHCLKMNWINEKFVEGNIIICCSVKCKKKSQMISCLFCRRPNYFIDKPYITGQAIVCGYPDCGKKFNSIICPRCKNYNYFPKGDFKFGKIYTCKYEGCECSFFLIHCPNCNSESPIEKVAEGSRMKCWNCHKVLLIWNCPFCNNNICENNSSLNKGQRVRCPNPECQKVYSFVGCPNCKQLVFSSDDSILDGQIIICNNIKCKAKFAYIRCHHCCVRHTILNQNVPIDLNKDKKCEKCHKIYKPKDGIIDKIYDDKENLSYFSEIRGVPGKLGKPSVDENVAELLDRMIITDEYNNPSIIMNNKIAEVCVNASYSKETSMEQSTELKKCMFCQCVIGESVFSPCGHRCACYKCAMSYFESQKHCPKCNEPSRAICRKVFD